MKRRRDGRAYNQLRPMRADISLLSNSDGSAKLEMGDTKVLVGITGPRPLRSVRSEDPAKAIVEFSIILPVVVSTTTTTTTYSSSSSSSSTLALTTPASTTAASSSTSTTSAEIELFLRGIYEPIIILSQYPRTVITITIHVQSNQGSLFAAIVNTVTLALLDAGVSMRGVPAAACVGLLRNNNCRVGVVAAAAESSMTDTNATQSSAATTTTTCVLDTLSGEEDTTLATTTTTTSTVDTDPFIHPCALATTVCTTATNIQQQINNNNNNNNNNDDNAHKTPLSFTIKGGLVNREEIQHLLGAGEAATLTVLTFLRLVMKKKIIRDSVNFERSMTMSSKELETLTFGK